MTLVEHHARSITLDVTGMTCASCAARIEKRLNRTPGVTATVNYATGRAYAEIADPGIELPHDLVAAVEAAGYAATEHVAPGHRTAPDGTADGGALSPTAEDRAAVDLRRRLAVSASLAAPVVALSMVSALQFGEGSPAGWEWLSLVLATPVIAWGALPIHRAALSNLRHRTATMDTLVSVGTLTAYLWSVGVLLRKAFGPAMPAMSDGFSLSINTPAGSGSVYFEVVTGVVALILAGRYLEAKARRRSGAAVRALLDAAPTQVSLLSRADTGAEVETRAPAAELAVADRFVVRPGERVATDGTVESGDSSVDVSLLTGETTPVRVAAGDAVVGGAVNTTGRLVVVATRVGADTQLARIAALVENAQHGKARAQRLADRVSGIFVPVVLAIAAATAAMWLLIGAAPSAALTAAVAVLIVACPCALGLATPTALLVGTGRGAQLGILIKGPEVLESTQDIDTVVLDKTGTLTLGRMAVVRVIAATSGDRVDVLRRAAAVEAASEHPVGRAIALAAADAGDVPAVEAFESVPGLGVRGVVEGHLVVVGKPAFVTLAGDADDPDDMVTVGEASDDTIVAVAWGGLVHGRIHLADPVKPTSRQTVERLRQMGLRPMLLTGDRASVAYAVAREVGIDAADVVADVLPTGKVEVIRRLQRDGKVVAMVGDGVNDAAALATADLGLAMGTGTDAAIEAADITLFRGEPLLVPAAIRLARRTLATIKGNLAWAFAYNVAAIPLAALGLLNPMIAGGAMAMSSLFVVGNSLRLRRFRPDGRPPRSA